GKIPEAEVSRILETALEKGIDTLDTASAYGESEKILGNFARSRAAGKFKVISKLSGCDNSQVDGIFHRTLDNLGMEKIGGYLIHDFGSYKKDKKIWDKLVEFKKAGKVEKIGFSLYYPRELDALLGHCPGIDIVQIPYSVFDRRFERYLPILKLMGVEVHARSVFLQGLAFKDAETLDAHFAKAKDKIERLSRLARETGASIASLCAGFVMSNKLIDKVIVGVDSLEHLIEMTTVSAKDIISDRAMKVLEDLKIDDEEIVLPFNWKNS
ncbi:MAG: aldo/keto reductase, partial [Candidatus Omnitrophica bacterium]|nr:aldo/keto reductase [Candidatus Omnitrophota bacterium]